MQIPTTINFVIEPEFATCFTFADGIRMDFTQTVPRSEFEKRFPDLLDLTKIRQLSYEPLNNHFGIIRPDGSATVYSDLSIASEEFLAIDDKIEEIYIWFYDIFMFFTRPSKYHEYDNENHLWIISSDNYKLLMLSNISNEIQIKLDEFAQSRNYDNIISACSYANSEVTKYQQEGLHCVQIRDAIWNKLYEIFAEVDNGTRPVPLKFEEIESEFPALVWPD
jgi:hypothetical protein